MPLLCGMNWKLSIAESTAQGDSITAGGKVKRKQALYRHTKSETHHIYVGQKTQSDEYFGIAYIGDTNPQKVFNKNATAVESFDSWIDAHNWVQAMKNYYRAGLLCDKPDVYDARKTYDSC